MWHPNFGVAPELLLSYQAVCPEPELFRLFLLRPSRTERRVNGLILTTAGRSRMLGFQREGRPPARPDAGLRPILAMTHVGDVRCWIPNARIGCARAKSRKVAKQMHANLSGTASLQP